mgnify:CR=1 FL=1
MVHGAERHEGSKTMSSGAGGGHGRRMGWGNAGAPAGREHDAGGGRVWERVGSGMPRASGGKAGIGRGHGGPTSLRDRATKPGLARGNRTLWIMFEGFVTIFHQ